MERKRFKKSLTVIIILLTFAISFFSGIIDFIVNYQWFKELGFTNTFFVELTAKLQIGVPIFLGFTLFLFLYFQGAKKGYYKKVRRTAIKKEDKSFNLIIFLSAAVIGFFIAIITVGSLWLSILKVFNGQSFHITDPIFNKDLSFYIFSLPLVNQVIGLLIFFIIVMSILIVLFYMLLIYMRPPLVEVVEEEDNVFDLSRLLDRGEHKNILNNPGFKAALFQIGILAFLLFILIGARYFFKSFDLLYSPRGVAYGASYTDVNITLWVYRIMTVASVLSGIGVLVGILKQKIRLIAVGPILMVILFIGGSLIGAGVQQFIVSPDEISKETPYLNYNIEFTQKAYNLFDVEEAEYPVTQTLGTNNLQNNMDTINSIRINDARPLIQVYNQLQAIRLYYDFLNVDVDRYMINGQYRQVFLSARELNSDRIPTQTWINQHLKYTHGYGLVMSPVNEVTSEGQPQFMFKSIPPITETDLRVDRPEIYFGEYAKDYVIVNTDEEEFDYPYGQDNVMAMYEGAAGIPLGGWNKLLFAIRENSLKLLLSGNINSDSRILINRNIMDRVQTLAPFLHYDDPYLVANQEDGKLYWIIDGYTTTDRYPYAQPYGEDGINYIRNSVKAVVDAYDGTVKFYIYDKEDPIINTYKNIFTDLFLAQEDMPAGLRNNIRYPIQYFNVQAEMYKWYHVDNPMVFYNGEDVWDVAQEKYMGEAQQQMEPNYVMFKLPDEDTAEFLLMLPYTPTTKPNMTSLLVARNDGENYGKLFLYRFPKGETIDGPIMIESRIDQNTDISQKLTLWSQKGSNVLRGNVIVVPIDNSLLYVEPIYLQAENENSLPEMKRVIVAYGDQLVMEPTLDLALYRIFGEIDGIKEVPQEGEVPLGNDINQLILNADKLFNQAREASQAGNWALYGQKIEELEKTLTQLREITQGDQVDEREQTDQEDIGEGNIDIEQ